MTNIAVQGGITIAATTKTELNQLIVRHENGDGGAIRKAKPLVDKMASIRVFYTVKHGSVRGRLEGILDYSIYKVKIKRETRANKVLAKKAEEQVSSIPCTQDPGTVTFKLLSTMATSNVTFPSQRPSL